MKIKILIVFILMTAVVSCGKKHVPERSTGTANEMPVNNAAKKSPAKRMAVPKVIAVNDKVAKRAVDGRMYYDVQGHRYWKNFDDGKYYLFNQSMFSNAAFKPH